MDLCIYSVKVSLPIFQGTLQMLCCSFNNGGEIIQKQRVIYSQMARAQQQRVLILHLLAHLARVEQPGVSLVDLRVQARPTNVVVGGHGLRIPAGGARAI